MSVKTPPVLPADLTAGLRRLKLAAMRTCEEIALLLNDSSREAAMAGNKTASPVRATRSGRTVFLAYAPWR